MLSTLANIALVYAAYLLFQLWSHAHLYKDTKEKSKRLSVKIPDTPRLFLQERKSLRRDVQKEDALESPSPFPSPDPLTPLYFSISSLLHSSHGSHEEDGITKSRG